VAAIPESRHFSLEPLTEGVWAALHRHGGWAVGNAGVIDLGDATLLFDAFLSADAARDLAAVARALTGRSPSSLVLSHYHNDHVRGAEVFPDATLIATTRTRELIDTLGREELASDREHSEAQLARVVAMADDDDPRIRSFAASFTPYWECLVASAPHATLRLPEVTFERTLTLHGSRRTAQIVSLGAAHTPDDAILVLPDDGVVFCSDLLFVGCHPFLADGDPDGWMGALAALAAYAPARFVPGHGPVGSAADVEALARHIRELGATAERLHGEGATIDDLERLLPTDDSAAWEFAYPFYRSNVRFLLGRARASRG
jgi:cyclase